jgi:hypothetical protein
MNKERGSAQIPIKISPIPKIKYMNIPAFY